MMKKVAVFFMVIAVGLFLLTVQSNSAEKPKYGAKLVVGHDIDAVGLDPYNGSSPVEFREKSFRTKS